VAKTIAEGVETVGELVAILQTLPADTSVTNSQLEYVDVIVIEDENDIGVEIV
jgi:hypothetical protein